jgi:hypothetical protein
MVLLHAGGWVDALPQIPEESILCRYLAEQKHIVFLGSSRLVRFPWLAVTDSTHDMSDFFTDLRITADREILHEDIMSLYTHQCQRFPVAPVQIITRSGDEMELDAEFQEVDASGSTVDVSGNVSDDVSGDIIIPGVQNQYPTIPTLDFIK